MTTNCGKNMTWRQGAVVIAMIGVLFIGFSAFNTKADKKELRDVEARCVCQIGEIKEEMKDEFDKFETKQDKIYDLLLKMNTSGYIPDDETGK